MKLYLKMCQFQVKLIVPQPFECEDVVLMHSDVDRGSSYTFWVSEISRNVLDTSWHAQGKYPLFDQIKL